MNCLTSIFPDFSYLRNYFSVLICFAAIYTTCTRVWNNYSRYFELKEQRGVPRTTGIIVSGTNAVATTVAAAAAQLHPGIALASQKQLVTTKLSQHVCSCLSPIAFIRRCPFWIHWITRNQLILYSRRTACYYLGGTYEGHYGCTSHISVLRIKI